jgi:hypothetical protein
VRVPRRRPPERVFTRLWPAVAAALLAVVLVLVRGRPSTDSDAGIFLSVAARLLDGDRLYADVWDNKDPLFFWTYAAALGVGDWRTPFLLDAVWLTIAGAGAAYLLRGLGASTAVTVLGLVSYPVLLTGAYYYDGYSMLPALALAPVAARLWLGGRFVAAGIVVGLAAMYKSNLTLVVAAGPTALGLLGHPEGRRGRPFLHALVGFAGALLAVAGALAARGELGPYVRTLQDNVSYAGDVLAATDRPTGIYGHLWSAAGVTEHTRALAVLVAAGLVLAAWTLRPGRRSEPAAALGSMFAAAVLATGITLATTAVWVHHAQVVAYPGFLLGALAALALQERVGAVRYLAPLLLGVTAVVVAAFGGFSRPPDLAEGSSWRSAGGSDTALSLEAAVAERPVSKPTSYAVLGTNHEQGHAAFLHGAWLLACPRFHQYLFSRHLTDVVSCIRRERPTLVVVDTQLADAPDQARWNAFVDEARRTLRTSYTRLPRASRGGVQVWRRR